MIRFPIFKNFFKEAGDSAEAFTETDLYIVLKKENWSQPKMTRKKKEISLNEILNKEIHKMAEEGIELDIYGHKVVVDGTGLDDFGLSVKIKEPAAKGSGATGLYRDRTIFLSPDICMKEDGSDLYYVLEHELRHGIQDFLGNNIERFEKNSDEYRCIHSWMINNTEWDVDIRFCGINAKGNLYFVLREDAGRLIEHVSFPLYYLAAAERDAFRFGAERGNQKLTEIGLNVNPKYGDHTKYLNAFRERHKIENIEEQEVYRRIDVAADTLFSKPSQINNIYASIMYDMACISRFQAKSLVAKDEKGLQEINKDTTKNLIDPYKKEVLLRHHFVIQENADISYMYERTQDYKNFTDIAKDESFAWNNPMIFLYAAGSCPDKAEAINEMLNDNIGKTNFLRYCIERREWIKDQQILRKGLECLLGPDISHMMMNLKNAAPFFFEVDAEKNHVYQKTEEKEIQKSCCKKESRKEESWDNDNKEEPSPHDTPSDWDWDDR